MEKNKNLELYEKYRKPPKEAVKPFSNGRFSGTDINTMWRIKCLTEEFGKCGHGWTIEQVKQWSEAGTDNEVLCFVEIKLHTKCNGEWGKPISATGGSRIVQNNKKAGYISNNDEGYKMATTDALGVACKYLGFGADIYWENDKTKYNVDMGVENKKTLQEKYTLLLKLLDKHEKTKQVLDFYKVDLVEQLEENVVDAMIRKMENAE